MGKPLVIIKGAGDLATGIAHRLYQCGFSILMLEIPEPTVIRRTVAFAETIYKGEFTVEGVKAALAKTPEHIEDILNDNKIAVVVDSGWESIKKFKPTVVIDAIIAKRNLGTTIDEAPITIGVGPGFVAGVNVKAVVETQRGHYLGKVIYTGAATPNTGVPGEVGGYSIERLLRAPAEGEFLGLKEIGEIVHQGETVAQVGEKQVVAPITGMVRGILKSGIYVSKGFKVGDIDPRAELEHCYTISDKARAVAGGVLEAVLHLSHQGANNG